MPFPPSSRQADDLVVETEKTLHCKKRLAIFPSPAGMSRTVSPRADLFYQLPAAILSRRRRKITKPPILGRAQINQQGNFGRAQINPPRQLWARPYQSARQLWARPYQSVRQQATISTSPPRGAPFSIYKANLGAPFSQGRALSNLSRKPRCPLLTGARPSPKGAPFPICQANLGAPSSQGRALLPGGALSYQSSSVPRT